MTIWLKPKYSKSAVNHAGDVLIRKNKTIDELFEESEALEILDNWRSIHSYPMHVFKIRLKRKAMIVDKNALTVQRLKRVPAITKKLQREYNGRPATMTLSQMQDIGGCRAILSNVTLARRLCDFYYMKGDLKHKRVKVNDYITNPKNDGYRSIHLIYKYLSNKQGKKDYNGLLIEVQIRSKLQHLWATAIETVDLYTRQAIKSSEGEEEWMEFFRLVSSAFAQIENCPRVPKTPINEKELYLEIKRRQAELKVISVMTGWMKAIKILEERVKQTPKLQYFLLELDIVGSKLSISSYTKDQEEQAIKDYATSEKKISGKREYDVVLVGADKSADLRKAYPNYFVDGTEFLINLQKIISKY
ncbi:MAG: RelA/SpoT domain-containing protein [Candidatus Methanoperedens sp.]|nr:RelA/SpoT domain-containing protein [Candidatus Methanoperedens sp.]MCE8426969.1 RelA/SpoT domain-containing protein [Candidatus Methanoperedens sp.]